MKMLLYWLEQESDQAIEKLSQEYVSVTKLETLAVDGDLETVASLGMIRYQRVDLMEADVGTIHLRKCPRAAMQYGSDRKTCLENEQRAC